MRLAATIFDRSDACVVWLHTEHPDLGVPPIELLCDDAGLLKLRLLFERMDARAERLRAWKALRRRECDKCRTVPKRETHCGWASATIIRGRMIALENIDKLACVCEERPEIPCSGMLINQLLANPELNYWRWVEKTQTWQSVP